MINEAKQAPLRKVTTATHFMNMGNNKWKPVTPMEMQRNKDKVEKKKFNRTY